MDLKVVRSIHLYSGCFLTPLLVFFLITGLLQTYGLHETGKNGYNPPAAIAALSQIHKNQRYATASFTPRPSSVFRWLMVVMTIGLMLNLVMGIILAFKFGHAPAVWISMGLGIVVPVVILCWPWLHRAAG